MKKLAIGLWVSVTLLPSIAYGHGGGHAPERDIGLSIRFDNGVSQELGLINEGKRFVDELDILATAETGPFDDGIDAIIESGDLSGLDWTGVELVDEEWRPDTVGTFTRQRFYRNAAWMERPSTFLIFQVDGHGHFLPVEPIVVHAGTDNRLSFFDDGFIRRFSARQITSGCVAVDDCSTATGSVVQGLVQLRQAQHPRDSVRILPNTATLRIFWTADPLNVRDVPVHVVAPADAEFGYGFKADFEILTPPANGRYYRPGDAITFRLNFMDGSGERLSGPNLPTYADFLFGANANGLRYFDLFLNPTLYYAVKHREGNLLLVMGGPSDKLRVTDNTVPVGDFFLPQTQSAFSDEQGFSAVVTSVPPFSVIFGGALFDPNIWNTPVPDEATLTVPADALPGTYVVALKARRDYAGEALNDGSVQRIQVGTNRRTHWTGTTRSCNTCHQGSSDLGNILHGIGDRESCVAGCHVALGNEPDNALDYRVHFIHSRSDRYPADPANCRTCHVREPTGIPRGYPGFVFPFE
jgi:hypothetical protein